MSLRGSNVPTWEAYSADKVDEFFEWLFKSNEAKKFQTVVVDSISQMAELYLQKALKEVKHGLQAYGTMSTQTLAKLNALYFTKEKHTYLTAKQEIITDGFSYKRPYFPGKELPVKIPHMYDAILHLDLQNIPGYGTHKAFRCHPAIDVLARDRTSLLSEYEPPHFGNLVKKCMRD